MGFATHARGVRDERSPLVRRHAELRSAVGTYCPLGFNATWAYLAATARPDPDVRGDPAALLRALETLEESRSVHLTRVRSFAARRHMEKAAGRRQPRASDVAGLRGPQWPSAAPPSRLGLIAAVADRHSAFRELAFPDPTLASETRLRALTDLHTRLDSWASSYLAAPGRTEERASEELTGIVRDISGFVSPGFEPLNSHLFPWLRFGHLLAYAARAHPAAVCQA